MRVGGCPAVVAQWQSTGGSSQRCPGFDSRQLPAFFTFLHFCPITSKFQREASLVPRPSSSVEGGSGDETSVRQDALSIFDSNLTMSTSICYHSCVASSQLNVHYTCNSLVGER